MCYVRVCVLCEGVCVLWFVFVGSQACNSANNASVSTGCIDLTPLTPV